MKFEIYCDECRPELFTSRVKSPPYLSIGGIWIPAEARENIKQHIKSLKKGFDVWGEVKWNKVASGKLDFYKSLISYFFENENMRFRTILMDSSHINLMQFHNNDAELGFYKFYYQLIHHWILDFNDYTVFVDLKTNRLPDRLVVLQRVLNYANLSSKIVNIQSLPSREVTLIQLTDLLTGAINAKFNHSTSSKAKLELIQFIEFLLKKEIAATPKSDEKFNIFKINLQGGW